MTIHSEEHPVIIQGGMGIAVSNWQLAKAVAQEGQLGVVSGTALNMVFVERLRHGDPGGHIERALRSFPFPDIAGKIYRDYFRPEGASPDGPFKAVPMYSVPLSTELIQLTVVANFVEVFLAKEGHSGKVGLNLLEKIQLPNLPSIYGAMLAGVDYVLMGAGIPREIPAVLDALAVHQDVSLKLQVEGASSEDDFRVVFQPRQVFGSDLPPLTRTRFLAIISSDTLALTLARKSTGKVDGFVIESPVAGGHNAPPRGKIQLDDSGQPIYGQRDTVNLDKIRELNLPFWLAGGYGHPGKLDEARRLGAAGIQVGTAFAFCEDSGLLPEIRHAILEDVAENKVRIFTDPSASPTGFPFKVVRLSGSNSEPDIYQSRPRLCQLGYLRQPYKRENGSLGYRCPSEPVEDYVRKGGNTEDTENRKCLCNGLLANIGFPQRQKSGYIEKTLVTAGDDLSELTLFLQNGKLDYSAVDVIHHLLNTNRVRHEVGSFERR